MTVLRYATRLLAALALAVLLTLGYAPTSPTAAAETCEQVTSHIPKGKKFHGASCYSSKGCDCSASKCTTPVTLYGTNHKSTVTKYKNAKCENYVDLPNKPNEFPGCAPIQGSINNGQSFHGVKCKDSAGCFCSAVQCSNGSYHKVSCWKAPT